MADADVSARSHALAYIGIGSNLAAPLAQVTRALAALERLPGCELVAVSPWYGSTPVGGEPGQPDYINGVACLRTTLSPVDLLTALQAVEIAQGRERKTHWGARTLDLDVLLYGNQVSADPWLTIPHPQLHLRAFVLRPLADIAPALVLPNGASVASLLAGLDTAGTWRLPVEQHNLKTQQDTDSQ